MSQLSQVYPAEPHDSYQLGSLGDASGMLIVQYEFPDTYNQGESHAQADDDRLKDRDHEHITNCIKKHADGYQLRLTDWFREESPEKAMPFLVDMLKAQGTAWTGYRVLATIGRHSGQTCLTLELFAKSPSSNTRVYTGDNAPNVLTGRRHQR